MLIKFNYKVRCAPGRLGVTFVYTEKNLDGKITCFQGDISPCNFVLCKWAYTCVHPSCRQTIWLINFERLSPPVIQDRGDDETGNYCGRSRYLSPWWRAEVMAPVNRLEGATWFAEYGVKIAPSLMLSLASINQGAHRFNIFPPTPETVCRKSLATDCHLGRLRRVHAKLWL